jgi:hypothetical protein
MILSADYGLSIEVAEQLERSPYKVFDGGIDLFLEVFYALY